VTGDPRGGAGADHDDRITLNGLRVKGFHGVFDHERRDGQDFVVDVTLHLDTSAAAGSDDLHDTVDYGGLALALATLIRGEPVDLLERLAQRLARRCLADPRVTRAEVSVHKPAAPIPETFHDVAVTISRRWRDLPAAQAVLGLGANLGERAAALAAAVTALESHPEIEVLAVSPVVETAPVLVAGMPAQPDYLNAVVRVATTLRPHHLLRACQEIEAEQLRTRETRWAARTLDVDLIAYDITDGTGMPWHDDVLELPHPRAAQRAFVLWPWSQLDPAARLPAGAVAELAARAPDAAGVRPRPGVRLPGADR
jgi:dihydroneopterin aldolase / 2-amino-4-hydroxy-6-hydroxymethyldihydropteridine diphosphokinase